LVLKHAKGTSKSFDGGSRSLDRGKVHGNGAHLLNRSTDAVRDKESNDSWKGNADERTDESADSNADEKSNDTTNNNSGETVSGFLYDMLQKEVISLRNSCHEKDQSLKDKDDAIEVCSYFFSYFCTLVDSKLYTIYCCPAVFIKESRHLKQSNGSGG
jgi:hypothetical protein